MENPLLYVYKWLWCPGCHLFLCFAGDVYFQLLSRVMVWYHLQILISFAPNLCIDRIYHIYLSVSISCNYLPCDFSDPNWDTWALSTASEVIGKYHIHSYPSTLVPCKKHPLKPSNCLVVETVKPVSIISLNNQPFPNDPNVFFSF